MWCPQCRSDVATEVAADGQSLLCTTCGSEVRKNFAPSLHPDVRRARDVLARLTRDNPENRADPGEQSANPAKAEGLKPSASDRTEAPPDRADSSRKHFGPGPAKSVSQDEPADDAIHTRRPEPEVAAAQPRDESSRRSFRVDAAHPSDAPHSHVSPPKHTAHAKHSEPVAARDVIRRDDGAHAVIPPPHFDVAAAGRGKPPGRSESTWGQLLAYFGVAVLTVGTALVLWGYFGGPPAYAPTGWLVTTAGQMLLLLGVITLISGGMQQTTHEVASRVAHLDGRMHRIETTAHELLHGPHFGHAARRTGRSAESDPESRALG